MKPLLTVLMLGNAALFVFGALQHAGVAIGSLHEPAIVPASIVEVLCALALSWGAAAVLKQSPKAWRAAFIGNLVATIGVVIEWLRWPWEPVRGPQATTFTTESCWRWRPLRS